jgi:hypothetical protein
MKSQVLLLLRLTAVAPCGGQLHQHQIDPFSSQNSSCFQLHRNLKQSIPEKNVALSYRLLSILVKSGDIRLIYMRDSIGTLRKGSAVYRDGSTRKRTYKKRCSKEIRTRIMSVFDQWF